MMSVSDPEEPPFAQPQQSSSPRFGIGFLAAFLLHQTIYAVGSALTAILAKVFGHAEIFQISPYALAWLSAWSGGAILLWWRKKPRLIEWAAPFTIFVGIWFLFAGAAAWHPDTPEESTSAAFAFAMFLACGAAWGLAFVLGTTRTVLGDGLEQRETLKRAVGYVVPAFRTAQTPSEDMLLRMSSQPDPPHETLLRPTSETETVPEQLLRASQSEDL
jgi:hypothetical protein